MDNLALLGGQPLVKNHADLRIDWPIVSDTGRRAINEVVDSNNFSGRGAKSVIELEEVFSKHYGGYATALNSGTAALHAALISIGLEPGDEVIVPNLTFVATATAVLHALGVPVFADIDPVTFNIEPESIKKSITSKTRAVIVVHLHGMPAEMDKILKICKDHGLKLIEDAAQSPGAIYKGKEVGTFGDAATFSLMPQKNIGTCGECGVLITSTLTQKNRAEMLRIYGEILFDNKPRMYNSFSLGWNYTLGPLEAALAIVQFKEYPKIMRKIQKRARELTKGLSALTWVKPPEESAGIESVFHFYRVRIVPPPSFTGSRGKFRKAVEDALNAEGLNVRYYQNTPVSGQIIFKEKKAFGKNLPWSLNDNTPIYAIENFPNTLDVLRSTLVLGAISSAPGYLLKDGTIEKYIEGFKKVDDSMQYITEYAEKIDYKEPWEEIPTTSDSFKAEYGIIDEI